MLTNNIINAVKMQKLYEDPKIEDIAVRITLINGDVYPFCFISDEGEKYLNIVETDIEHGLEKINVLLKEGILGVRVLYNDDIFFKKKKKKEK